MSLPHSDPTPPAARRNRSQNHHARRWIPYAGALLLVGLIVAGLWPQPVPVEVARASVGRLRATVNEEGKTRIKQRYVVSAPVSGQLRRIPFKAGAEVRADKTVVAVIRPALPNAAGCAGAHAGRGPPRLRRRRPRKGARNAHLRGQRVGPVQKALCRHHGFCPGTRGGPNARSDRREGIGRGRKRLARGSSGVGGILLGTPA